MRHAIIVNHIQWVFIYLLNNQSNCAFTPDVIFVSHVNFGVDFETTNSFIFLRPLLFVLALFPFEFDGFVLAIFHELINDVVYFEAVDRGLVADHNTLLAIKVTYETCLNNHRIESD